MLGLLGSPPQVRGKRTPHATIHAHAGITPAGAGKTHQCPKKCPAIQDHPRRCGENLWSKTPAAAIQGSPPQVRGKLDIDEATGGRIGITPAGAGKTRRSCGAAAARWDHPRRCGENWGGGAKPKCPAGSPPQVRGKLSACVQKGRLRVDHPRRCGENLFMMVGKTREAGSPPQVRGKLQAIVDALPQIRITPAGAGKTRGLRVPEIRLQDHPRRCGENLRRILGIHGRAGSPPQVRGKRSSIL